ncbi:hypothetical protein LCGC14_0782000 [marine sediment metagenome]|uniref:Uncharacterized protein n=1 Tax=marine sediment metagenome TaxID=412755 RepID=A0A0F9PVE5_9ZZZZ
MGFSVGFGIKASDITAIKAKTDGLPADPADASDINTQISATNVLVNALQSAVDDVDTVVDAIKVQTDLLPSDPADQSDVVDEVKKGLSSEIFWSDTDDTITITTTAADDALPSVVVSGIPAGAAITRVVVIIKIRAIENTNGSANNLNGAQDIEVKESAAGSWIAAINLAASMWAVAASTREAGDVLIGDIDVKAQVTGNGTYNLQLAMADAAQNNLVLNDVLVGLKVSWTTS